MKKIVLIEDDKMLAEIYQIRLQQARYDCVVANDGVTGVALVQKQLPDLVLLDLMLPQLSGDEVLRAIRTSDWGKTIPVLILTNISEAEAPTGLHELGIEGYIVKANLVNNQLSETVEKILNKTPTTNIPEPTS